ncbi:MAG: RNA polymerase sigma factor [Pseudomonadota bacterium]
MRRWPAAIVRGAMSDPFVDDLIALLPRLRRYAISLSRSRDVADDLVQTACERALAKREQFDPGTRLDAWVMRILRNLWIDMARQNKARGPTVDVDDAYYLVGDDGGVVTDQRLRLAETAKAIGSLSDEYREVLMLICVDDLSYREAAEVLGVPMGTVTSRLARARAKLDAMLEE